MGTSCVDLNEAYFSYKKYNDALIFKIEKTDRKCKSLAKENDITIIKNCADKIIRDYCKLTCDNCGDDSAAPSISVSASPSISVTVPGCFDNDDEKFNVNHSSGKPKGCVWLRNNFDEQAERCVDSDAKKICKNTCDIGCTTSSLTTSSPMTSSPCGNARNSNVKCLD